MADNTDKDLKLYCPKCKETNIIGFAVRKSAELLLKAKDIKDKLCLNCGTKLLEFRCTCAKCLDLIDEYDIVNLKFNEETKHYEVDYIVKGEPEKCQTCGKPAEINIQQCWVRYDWDTDRGTWTNEDIYAVDENEFYCAKCWEKECEETR